MIVNKKILLIRANSVSQNLLKKENRFKFIKKAK